MSCLTPEQLAELAIDLDADRPVPPHVHECEACAAQLAEFARVCDQLSHVHAQLNDRHETSRAELISRLGSSEPPTRTVPRRSRIKTWQRLAVSGLGLSAVAAVLLVMFSLGPTEKASAMERMIAKLRELTSCEYSMHTRNTFTREGADEPVNVDYVGTVRFQSPQALGEEGPYSHTEEGLIYEFPTDSPPGERKSRLLSRFEVRLPVGQSGILIDHLRECFIWVPEFRGEFGESSPVTRLLMVKDREGEMIRELGTKEILGKQAHGFVMRLEGAEKGSGYDALNVWIDPETDLPLEIAYEVKEDWGSKWLRIYDCRWNLELSPHLFEAHAPEGYTDSTPPKDPAAIDAMIAALRLYSELSGGHYPRVMPFHEDEILQEMLKMAGFTGELQEEWADDEMYQRIQQTKVGFDWLTRVLVSEPHAKYFGESVGPDDTNKALFWCTNPGEGELYRVIYGNLETEVVEGDWMSRLNEGHSPREESK